MLSSFPHPQGIKILVRISNSHAQVIHTVICVTFSMFRNRHRMWKYSLFSLYHFSLLLSYLFNKNLEVFGYLRYIKIPFCYLHRSLFREAITSRHSVFYAELPFRSSMERRIRKSIIRIACYREIFWIFKNFPRTID